ncbi:MAG: hypothetical protein WBC50_10295 [Dehalococcoidales bacterium]
MSKKVLKLEDKKVLKVKITNFMIENFQREQSFMKLRRAIGLGAADKYKIFKLAEILMNGPEARALNAAKDELVKTTEEKKRLEVIEAKGRFIEGKEKEVDKAIKEIEQKSQLTYTHPKVRELMELESGIELEKLILQASKLPADFTPEDMMITSWLIEYKDDTKGQ